MDSKLDTAGIRRRRRITAGSLPAAAAVALGLLLMALACDGADRATAGDNAPAAAAAVTSPTSAPGAVTSAAVCSPQGNKSKALPAGATRVLRRYLDRLADGRLAAAQRLATPGSAATRQARALAGDEPRLTALDDHY